MTNEAYLETLREHVTKLKALLDDPHPGLTTWCVFYVQHMQAISDLWNIPKEELG